MQSLLLTFLLLLHDALGYPNVIFMFADDLGWNDVEFTSATSDSDTPTTDTQTPLISALARDEGIILDHYYVHRLCSPSRAAFMTGRLPHRYAMDTHLLVPPLALAMSRQLSIISEEFSSAGYDTHAIGKWHLGFQSKEYTPTYRGFDTFYGYWTGGVNYYNSTTQNYGYEGTYYNYRDLHADDSDGLSYQALDGDDESDYGIYRFRMRACSIIEAASSDTPFFMYLAWQSSHAPSEAPDSYYNEYKSSASSTTRAYNQAQTTSMDDAIGHVVTTLKSNGLWSNTILVVSSDNGADEGYGDNYPLRGYKHTHFEGGLRVPAFITGGYIDSSLYGTTWGSYNYFAHVTDWYPTLLDMAGIEMTHAKSTKQENSYDAYWDDTEVELSLDGMSIWPYINGSLTLDDDDVRVMIMDVSRSASMESMINGTVRHGKYKYIKGLGNTEYSSGLMLWSDESESDDLFMWGRDFARIEDETETTNSLGCDLTVEVTHLDCFETSDGCLFDLESDPCEITDLSLSHSSIRSRLSQYLVDLYDTLPFDVSDADLYLSTSGHPVWYPTGSEEFWKPFQPYKNVDFEPLLYEHWTNSSGSYDQVNSNAGLQKALVLSDEVDAVVGTQGEWEQEAVLNVLLMISLTFVGLGLYLLCWSRKWYGDNKVDAGYRSLMESDVVGGYGATQN